MDGQGDTDKTLISQISTNITFSHIKHVYIQTIGCTVISLEGSKRVLLLSLRGY